MQKPIEAFLSSMGLVVVATRGASRGGHRRLRLPRRWLRLGCSGVLDFGWRSACLTSLASGGGGFVVRGCLPQRARWALIEPGLFVLKPQRCTHSIIEVTVFPGVESSFGWGPETS